MGPVAPQMPITMIASRNAELLPVQVVAAQANRSVSPTFDCGTVFSFRRVCLFQTKIEQELFHRYEEHVLSAAANSARPTYSSLSPASGTQETIARRRSRVSATA